MADPTWRSGRHRKDKDEDTEISLGPIGESAEARTALVESALLELEKSVKAKPAGLPAQQLFNLVRGALASWRARVNEQRWDDLTQEIGAMLQDVDTSMANPKYMADMSLLLELRERLVALQSALAPTG
jgi:hypothetical protein